jgi:phospholipase A1
MKYLLICLMALTSLASESGVDRVRQEYESLLKKKYVLLPHKGIYLLPASYNNTPNKEAYEQITERFRDRGEFNRELEAEFQVSFLILVNQKPFGSKFNLFLGYTHRSWWQVYNGDWSRQFRETNYEPEFFARRLFSKPKKVLGLNFIGYDFGYVHQSNGQIQELSRSWDRAFARMIFNFGNTVISPSLWYRLPDTDNLDENPDTEEYIGHGELLIQKIYGPNQFRFKLLPGIHKMGAEFSYSYPLNEGLRYFIKLNYGYGHSLIDYNKKTERIGVGISISDILSGLSE